MKHKKRNILLIVVGVLCILIFISLPKPVVSSNAAFDLTQIADGLYEGNCDNGVVSVEVEVKVQNHKISEVKILKHNNGLGSAAESISERIVKQQSVEVDSVSSATLSSMSILKAVEDALMKGQEAS